MKDDKAVTKVDTYHRLRTQIALLRHAMANTKNPQLLVKYAAQLAPLLRRLEMTRKPSDG